MTGKRLKPSDYDSNGDIIPAGCSPIKTEDQKKGALELNYVLANYYVEEAENES